MLNDCIDIFKKVYDENKENGIDIVLDNYTPSEGQYIIFDENFELCTDIYIKLNKDGSLEDETLENLDFIKMADYYSKIIAMNKPIDNKKIIHSNNYLSFFVKGENIKNKKLTPKILDGYYDILSNPSQKYKNKKSSRELFKKVNEQLGDVDIELLNKCKNCVNLYINNIDIKSDKQYVKIFFKQDSSLYKQESDRYTLINIYNDNEYNTTISDMVYGMPSNNLGLNSKKIYLKNKSRKNDVPYLVRQDDIIIQKLFFDFLYSVVSKKIYTLYFDIARGILVRNYDGIKNLITWEEYGAISGFEINLKKGMEVEIIGFDIIDFKNDFQEPIHIKNCLEMRVDKLGYTFNDNGVCEVYTYKNLEQIINSVVFSKFLITNYFSEDISVKDSNLKRNIIIHRNKLNDWLRRGNYLDILKVIDDMTKMAINNSLLNNNLFIAKEQLNLRMSLLKHFGGNDMIDRLVDIKQSVRKKINENTTSFFENDEEYYFSIGQAVAFMNTQSKSKKKNNAVINVIINAKSDELLKRRLTELYKKYNYSIDSKRFGNLFSMIMSYSTEKSIMEDIIISGFLSSNLIYEKLKENNSEEK